MLRCGQMILAEALVRRHLGREWRWVRGQQPREEYMSILNAFIDKKDSYYSIHQIAQMGVGEGKSIGQWYGPNTVAQVLKKLSVFDTWSRLAVHVAMDNTVIIEEIKRLCMPWLDFERGGYADPLEMNGYMEGACAMALEDTAVWKPLVLLIPLRLGLSDINEAYIETLKQCFMMPQSLGVIGGKPNSAHYFIGFVDLEKAYDRVPREELWYCMRKSGVAEKYVRVVQDMYERSRTVVRCAVGQAEEFKVEVGLHQGSALSPFPFVMVMDQLSEEVRKESPWTMMFADDIVICSESREQVEKNLERWRFALEIRVMKVSRSKMYMCVNEREGSGTVRLQGEEVKKVQEFKYLGSTVQSNGECGKEVKKRVQAGWNGWRKVSGVLCDRKISARIKGKVYRTVMRPAMLYGLETVSLRKRQESELEVAELKMLRFSLGVTRLDRIRNEYIRGTAHVGRLGDKVREARLRWFGHVQRRESEELIYLDPHTTQPAVEPCENGEIQDDSYHCQHPPCRMHICELDPSIAVGFFCQTEDDFDDWCAQIRKLSSCRGLPMFELVDSQPSHLINTEAINLTPDFSDSDRLERFFDSEDEEFEILSL
ncbi:hypothetical protein QTP70_026619 [Hemibagrus guttatus]|uniref:Cysteine protease n=1 Tax=Hemibagrus guttatus TaxID=175788 RepID=A0AAE0RL66_9TELE|nr:hypothetical protein QTP70_026619 [Hemibagrus guttatus]